MIVGWIRSSIEPRFDQLLFLSQILITYGSFSVGNKVRIQHLKEQLSSCKQEGQSVMEYYGRLAKTWEELDMYKSVPLAVAVLLLSMRRNGKKRNYISSSWVLMKLDLVAFVKGLLQVIH